MKEYLRPYWSNVIENVIVAVLLFAYYATPAATWMDSQTWYIRVIIVLFAVVFTIMPLLTRAVRHFAGGKYHEHGLSGFLIMTMLIGYIGTLVAMNTWIALSILLAFTASLYYYYIPLNIYAYVHNKFTKEDV